MVKYPCTLGWFGTFWSTNREKAPVINFGGPFTPRILRRKEFTIGEAHERLSLCFLNFGSGAGAESRLSIDALPRFAVPSLTIEWPTSTGDVPLRTTHKLDQRCCYWEFYRTDFEVPRGVVPGMAKISVDLPVSTIPIELTTTKLEMSVVAPTNAPDSAH